MTERPVGVTDQATGAGIADVRTRERTVGGNTVAEQYVIPISERVASYKGMATTFRIPGRAATTQNLFSIYNTTGSAVLVAVRRLSIQMDATAALATVAKSIKTTRQTTAPTNGTSATKVPFDSAQSSAANVEVRGDASADGTGSATTLTATPSANVGWSQFVMRLHTAAGQVLMDDESCIPVLCADDPVILRANEGLLVAIVAAATTSNPITDHHVVNCMWEEFTLP
jgi:hypothetical protein